MSVYAFDRQVISFSEKGSFRHSAAAFAGHAKLLQISSDMKFAVKYRELTKRDVLASQTLHI